jgi:hypothetical protein
MHGQWYLLDTEAMVIFPPKWPTVWLSCSSKPIASICFVAHTLDWYLSNMSTKFTSLFVWPCEARLEALVLWGCWCNPPVFCITNDLIKVTIITVTWDWLLTLPRLGHPQFPQKLPKRGKEGFYWHVKRE